MATKSKRDKRALYQKNNKPQGSSSQSRHQTENQVKTHAPAKTSNSHKTKGNNHARVSAGPKSKDPTTTTVSQRLNSKSSTAPSPPGVNRKQKTDMRIERSLAANTTTGLEVQQPSPAMHLALTPKHDTSCPSPTRKASFLLLPPEIRWQIYQEIFHPRRVEVLRRKGKKRNPHSRKATRYRLSHRQLAPRDTLSQRPPWFPRKFSARRSLPTALMFTCRLTYCETINLFYATTQFVFRGTKPAARFLKTTSRESQSAIRHVELQHVMYNEPRLTEFRKYKFRSDRSWYLVCDQMSQNFQNLRVLHVDLAVNDWPIQLEIGEQWSFPLLVFGENGHLLDSARISLQMPMFSKEKLRVVSRSIEERLMKPEAFQIREDAILAKKLMGPVKARKILRLNF